MGATVVEAILLGTAQDAGVPQAGCDCSNCSRARRDPAQRRFTACLGLVDREAGQSWLVDATPDFREQQHTLHQFAADCALAGILLTHAHIGHYPGLLHIGHEAMNAHRLPVYASERMAEFLRGNAPWSQLVEYENIELRSLTSGVESVLSPNLSVVPVSVPHRQEFSDTFAFVARGAQRRLFYCPDIDDWELWEHDLQDFAIGMDVVFVDATFYNANELPQRDMDRIGHPLVMDTAERLMGLDCQVRLVHLNHTSPLFTPGPERELLREYGIEVGRRGEHWVLG
jgi:pyrroloquinoline quinone biosynthesis protein B